MRQLDKLETTLDDVFNKKAPKIPAEGRKSLAGALWWLALIFGLLQLWSAWELWRVSRVVDRTLDYAVSLGVPYSGTSSLGFFYYLSVMVIVAAAVLLLLAVPALKEMRKAGWNFLFYGLLLNAAYGVVVLFSDYGGVGEFLWSMASSAVGAYLLFQVREHFVKSSHPAPKK